MLSRFIILHYKRLFCHQCITSFNKRTKIRSGHNSLLSQHTKWWCSIKSTKPKYRKLPLKKLLAELFDVGLRKPRFSARFEFRFESLKSISVLILFAYKLMTGSSKNNRENYPRKCFWKQEKGTRVNINLGLSANRPSNNWALDLKKFVRGFRKAYKRGTPPPGQHFALSEK